MARKSKLVELEKQRPNNKTEDEVRRERDQGGAQLIRAGGENVSLQWGMNRAMREDQVLAITVGDQTGLIYVEDLLRFTRWV